MLEFDIGLYIVIQGKLKHAPGTGKKLLHYCDGQQNKREDKMGVALDDAMKVRDGTS